MREMQQRMGQSDVSLDQPAGADEDTTLLDVLPDTDRQPRRGGGDAEWRAFAQGQSRRFAEHPGGQGAEIFNSRLLAEQPLTLQEIGEQYGISRERVRQIETRLKRKLKEFIKSQAADIDQAAGA